MDKPNKPGDDAVQAGEAARLERLWSGAFGDAYVDRNALAGEKRGPFWQELLARAPARNVLEVGCNVGGNLRWLAALLPPEQVWGVDINTKALATLRGRLPTVNAVWSAGRELPFRDGWFDLTFTAGVLIHQPDESLPIVMEELFRTSRRFVLALEYFSPTPVEVPYRGEEGALFKRDYGALFLERFKALSLIGRGELGAAEGWDDVTWWLFEKSA